MLRASANRALDGRRSDERTRLSFAKRDDDVGLLARDAPAAKPRQTTRSVGQIALPTRFGRMLRASANRALDGRRSDERTRLSFAKSDDDVGLLARDAPAAKPRQTTRSV